MPQLPDKTHKRLKCLHYLTGLYGAEAFSGLFCGRRPERGERTAKLRGEPMEKRQEKMETFRADPRSVYTDEIR
jgi:hypothetical protein